MRQAHLALGSPDLHLGRADVIVAACGRALRDLPDGPTFGVDLRALCGGATTVLAARLDRDDKVRVEADRVLVHTDCVESLAAGPLPLAMAERLAVLYLLHELAHLPQGIGDYAAVKALRERDETLVLQLDLAADHVAALALKHIEPNLGFADIKALQSRGLCDFPATKNHAPAARLRKARRMVSVCADVLLRRRGVLGDADGYVEASFGRGDASLALMQRGAGADRLLGLAKLDVPTLTALACAADQSQEPAAHVARLEQVVGRLVDAPPR